MIFGLWVVFYMKYYIKKPFESIENIKNIKYEISNVNRFLTCIVKPNNKGNCENETYMVNDILFRKKHQFVII